MTSVADLNMALLDTIECSPMSKRNLRHHGEKAITTLLRVCFSRYVVVDMSEMNRAGLGIRLAALAIDWAIATMTTALFVPPFSSALGPSSLRLGIFLVEVSIVTGFTGSSMGQRMMGLRVLSWPDHLFVSPMRAFLRTLLIALVIPAVVYDNEGRGLHERITQTTVVRIKSR